MLDQNFALDMTWERFLHAELEISFKPVMFLSEVCEIKHWNVLWLDTIMPVHVKTVYREGMTAMCHEHVTSEHTMPIRVINNKN